MEDKRTGDTIFNFFNAIFSYIATFIVLILKIIVGIWIFPSIIIYLIRKRKGETFSYWFNWSDPKGSMVAFVLTIFIWISGVILAIVFIKI